MNRKRPNTKTASRRSFGRRDLIRSASQEIIEAIEALVNDVPSLHRLICQRKGVAPQVSTVPSTQLKLELELKLKLVRRGHAQLHCANQNIPTNSADEAKKITSATDYLQNNR